MKDGIELLIHSLDHELTLAEQQRLTAALKASATLRAEQAKYLKLRTMVAQSVNPAPGDFTDKVLQKWIRHQQPNGFGARVVQLFPRVAAAAAAVLLVTWSTFYLGGENMVLDALIGLDGISPDEASNLLAF